MWKDGYEFDSWNTQADGSGTSYSAGTTISSLTRESFTLYAKWKTPTTTLSIGGTHHLTKTRVYDKFGYYHDYTNFSNMVVYPGKDVILYHGSSYGWAYGRKNSDALYIQDDFGKGTAFCFTIPTDATGSRAISICGGATNIYHDGNIGSSYTYFSATQWDCITSSNMGSEEQLLGAIYFNYSVGNGSGSQKSVMKVYDDYNNCRTYTGYVDYGLKVWCRPGNKIVLSYTGTKACGWMWQAQGYGCQNIIRFDSQSSYSIRFLVPSSAKNHNYGGNIYFSAAHSDPGTSLVQLTCYTSGLSNYESDWLYDAVPEIGD